MAATGSYGAGLGWPGLDDQLAQQYARTVDLIDALSRSVREIIAASRDVATDDEHDPEGHTIAFERAQAAALLSQARDRLGDIEAARARLRAGTYGVCERCGQPIAQARLEARPVSRTCIACASRRG